MRKWLSTWSRKLHRWGAVIIALPVVVVFVTGVILQLKKDVAWVQPPTAAGVGGAPSIGFDQILSAAASVPEAEVATWEDIDRLDVRPDKGMVKVRAMNSWEVQIDTSTAEVLQVAYRRSDLIEQIHDGSWFSDAYGKYVFLVQGLVLIGLWLTGAYLWLLPYIMRRSRARKAAAAAARGAAPPG